MSQEDVIFASDEELVAANQEIALKKLILQCHINLIAAKELEVKREKSLVVVRESIVKCEKDMLAARIKLHNFTERREKRIPPRAFNILDYEPIVDRSSNNKKKRKYITEKSTGVGEFRYDEKRPRKPLVISQESEQQEESEQ